MGIEGFGVLIAAVLVLAVVVPALARQRFVAVSTPLDDRYAADLRMLRVGDTPGAVVGDDDGHRGSVFFRRPEVEMAGKPVVDVRELARNRAQLRARMSERAAKLRRGFWGACALGTLTILTWILVAATNLAAAVGFIALALTASYVGAFARVVTREGKADETDRIKLARIEEELGPRRIKRSKGKNAGARKSGENSDGHVASRSKRAGSFADGGRTVAKPGTSKPGRGRSSVAGLQAQKSAGADENERSKKNASLSSAVAAGFEVESDSRGVKSGEIEAGNSAADKAHASSSQKRERSAAPKRSGRGENARDAVVRDRGNLERGTAEEKALVSRASVPSYTLKPRGFERRVVNPYVAPEAPTAAVPYRPQGLGERYDAATGAVLGGSKSGGAAGSKNGYAAGTVYGGTASAHGVDDSSVAAVASGADSVLSGGSVLDELLERRRA